MKQPSRSSQPQPRTPASSPRAPEQERRQPAPRADADATRSSTLPSVLPTLEAPRGGASLRGMGEKFAVSPATGAGNVTLPVPLSPGRAGAPDLTLSWSAAVGQSAFGLGWSLNLPSVRRSTDKRLPRYTDDDTFILAGAEDLVPALRDDGTPDLRPATWEGRLWRVQRFLPRTEGAFARIERWTGPAPSDVHWRVTSPDNVTTRLGSTAASRIYDPHDPTHIFEWLIDTTLDDRGNATRYLWKREDDAGVDLHAAHEQHRSSLDRSAQRYLKRVRWGNRTSALLDPTLAQPAWMFEVVLDYGEHDLLKPTPGEAAPWTLRPDPLSSRRPGFELRTLRLCRRFLIFHHFPDDPATGADRLVRALELHHRTPDPAAPTLLPTLLVGAVQRGYGPDGAERTLPALTLRYVEPRPDSAVRTLDAASTTHLDLGPEGDRLRWVDLDGDGLTGLLTEQAGAWMFKRNTSPAHRVTRDGAERVEARLGPLESLPLHPSSTLRNDTARLMDLDGDGRLELVIGGARPVGFYGRDDTGGWLPFRALDAIPRVDLDAPGNLLIDLDGDGRADLLCDEGERLTWYPSRGAQGYGPAEHARKPDEPPRSPRLLLADTHQALLLADMTGDGLTDLVRVRNGEVAWWPNLGLGRFGRRVVMDDSPWLAPPDLFDPRRVRLADIDGTGPADLLYIGHEDIQVYANRGGDRWSPPRRLPPLPHLSPLASIAVMDLLGTGTACLVWRSPLPGDAHHPLQYIDLMSGQKPWLLEALDNGLGAETHLTWAPSTRFYLEDREAGRPWLTRLPFPVHVVARADTTDHVGRTRTSTRYTWHHGWYDTIEREFHGFGRVDQWEISTLDALHPADVPADRPPDLPPTLTRSWFHTGAWEDQRDPALAFAHEYADLPGSPRQTLPGASNLPADLDPDEVREALRALRGQLLRREVFVDDSSQLSHLPYTITEQTTQVRLVQRRGPHRHAVFLTTPAQEITRHVERLVVQDHQGRDTTDPRTSHTLTLDLDPWGRPTRTAAIAYGRRLPDPSPLLTPADHARQAAHRVTCTLHRYTDPALTLTEHTWRLPLPCEEQTFEVHLPLDLTPDPTTHVFPEAALRTALDDLANGLHDLAIEDTTSTARPARRLLQHSRTLYRSDDLQRLLPLHTLHPLAITGQTFSLAFTEPHLRRVLRREGAPLLTPAALAALLADEGGYTRGDDLRDDALFPADDPTGRWWTSTPRVGLSPDPAHTAAQELEWAQQHFFLPHRAHDAFGGTSTVRYDRYDLRPLQTVDPVGNRTTVGERDADNAPLDGGWDYHALAPRLLTDPNGDRTAFAFDAHGRAIALAHLGRPDDPTGDSLDGLVNDPSDADLDAFLLDPDTHAHALLANASARWLEDLRAFERTRHTPQPQPTTAATIARERHVLDLPDGAQSRLQLSFAWTDGLGREIQKKTRTSPDPDGQPRWIASGWTIFNNKDLPVRQYEPFFTPSWRFEFARSVGVSPTLLYDPAGRALATLHPDHTWEKVTFDPWTSRAWDANDTTLLEDPTADPHVGGYFARLPAALHQPSWQATRRAPGADPHERAAARAAALHADTPTTTHLDALGHTFLTISHNRTTLAGTTTDTHPTTRADLDIQGRTLATFDALHRLVARFDLDPLGRIVHQATMEAGERWTLHDAANNPLRTWDSRGATHRYSYDPLRRLLRLDTTAPDGTSRTAELHTWGEQAPDAEHHRLRLKPWRIADPSGLTLNHRFDRHGNATLTSRRLLADAHQPPDWSADPALDDETFWSSARYDAANHLVQHLPTHTDRHGAAIDVLQPTWDEAGRLAALDVWLQLPQTPTTTHLLLDPATASTRALTRADYNARGQRTLVEYGNGARTTWTFDPLTFRLTRLRTEAHGRLLQDLHYTWDPIGNPTHIHDDAQQTIFFRNALIEPHTDYTYDALYRLIEATGREHLGQGGAPSDDTDAARMALPHPGDGDAMGRYTERYTWDDAGNLLRLQHLRPAGLLPGWTRTFLYDEPSPLQPERNSNRLSATRTGDDPARSFTWDAHGCCTSTPELPLLRWDDHDQLIASSRQHTTHSRDPDTLTCYTYDKARQRTRKTTLHKGVRRKERLYFGDAEVYREFSEDGTTPTLQRLTLHLADDHRRIALIETRTLGHDPAPRQLTRYQLDNHLGSATIELDHQADIISAEEYLPFGSTAFQATRNQTDSPKRYRFTAQERDEETGLNYHGARYYAPWLARWISADPAGWVDGLNLYEYAKGRTTAGKDIAGKWFEEVVKLKNSAEKLFQEALKNPAETAKTVAPVVATVAKASALSRVALPLMKFVGLVGLVFITPFVITSFAPPPTLHRGDTSIVAPVASSRPTSSPPAPPPPAPLPPAPSPETTTQPDEKPQPQPASGGAGQKPPDPPSGGGGRTPPDCLDPQQVSYMAKSTGPYDFVKAHVTTRKPGSKHVGMLLFNIIENIESGRNEMYIQSVVVDPECRQAGLGTNMLKAALEHAQKTGRDVDSITGQVTETSTNGEAYQKGGAENMPISKSARSLGFKGKISTTKSSDGSLRVEILKR